MNGFRRRNCDTGLAVIAESGYIREGSLNIIEMGARQYLPTAGRFLSVDPVPGGSANDYDYCAGDAVNCEDLAGAAPAIHRAPFRSRSDRAISHFFDVRFLENWAFAAAYYMFSPLTPTDNGYVNAARHFMISAVLSYLYGPGLALSALAGHEVYSSKSHQFVHLSMSWARDTSADIINNQAGAIYGTTQLGFRVSLRQFEDRAYSLVMSGQLATWGGVNNPS